MGRGSCVQSPSGGCVHGGGVMAAALSLLVVSLPLVLVRLRAKARHSMHMEELMNLNAPDPFGPERQKLQKQASDPGRGPVVISCHVAIPSTLWGDLTSHSSRCRDSIGPCPPRPLLKLKRSDELLHFFSWCHSWEGSRMPFWSRFLSPHFTLWDMSI